MDETKETSCREEQERKAYSPMLTTVSGKENCERDEQFSKA